jgi:hypothetical protein
MGENVTCVGIPDDVDIHGETFANLMIIMSKRIINKGYINLFSPKILLCQCRKPKSITREEWRRLLEM